MAKYSKGSQNTVKSAMHRMKKGKLKSGSGAKVKSRKQAIAIGLSEAREKGAKVPPKKAASKKSARQKSASKKSAPGKAASKKNAPRKAAARKSTGRARSKKSAPKKAAAKKGTSRKRSAPSRRR